MRFARLLTAIALSSICALPARAFDTVAQAAFAYDLTTDTVILEKDADKPLPPASMSKLMTLNMLFEALRDGRVELDTRFSVSTKAKSMGGSTMFLNELDRPTVEELIKGIVVLSGNDACVAVAEGLAGSESTFAQQMTERGKLMGLTNSTFVNSSGWPDPNHLMSMRDLGILSAHLIREFPEYYGYFSLKEFPWDGRAPQNRFNRNPLLRLGIGADGLKTGHTTAAGYGLAGSAKKGDRRIVFVLGGLDSEKQRASESEKVVNWAFRQFTQKTVVKKNTPVAEVPVWMGKTREVGLVTAEDVPVLIPAVQQGDIEVEAVYKEPIQAPGVKGQIAGELVIRMKGMPDKRVELFADEDIPQGGIIHRIGAAASIMASWVIGITQMQAEL